MEIQFDKKNEISGARIVQYLLEKSRIVSQAESERNYHIFYQLLAAPAEEKAKYELGNPEDYFYLNKSGCTTIENVDDSEDYDRFKSSMQTLGFSGDEQETIFASLAAVLHLGNVNFKKNEGKGEGSVVANNEVVTKVSNLLSCSTTDLETSLCQRVNYIKGEKFIVPLTVNEANDNRDALAKVLYATLFNWIVERINTCIVGSQTKTFIGVLDIFGFENFKVNSFEQFCINYTNEKLQQMFNHHIFKLEQEEYNKEKINWEKVTFKDNQECIDLIEKKPMGVLSLLDEECRFPKGSDKTLLEKLHQNHAKHPNYEAPKKAGINFIVKHYAGEVSYDISGFLDKNKDTTQDELLDLLYASTNTILADQIFGEQKTEKLKAIEEEKANKGASAKKKGGVTVAQKFKDQLSTLVYTLTTTSPHYIRCLKPNTLKKSEHWDPELVLAQLRYAGMMETIRIRRLGYPIRMGLKEFFDRYRMITLTRYSKDIRADCQTLLNGLDLPKEEWQLGQTKVFLRENIRAALEDRRNSALKFVVIKLQKWWRGAIARKKYLRVQKASVRLQSEIRGFAARIWFYYTKALIVKLQAAERRRRQRREYLVLRNATVTLQLAILQKSAVDQYNALLQEKREREERERQERERVLAERALLAEQERLELERMDREEEERQKQEKEQQRLELEQRRQELELQHKQEQLREKQEKIAEEEKQGLKELGLGLLSELDNLEDLLRKDLPPPVDPIPDLNVAGVSDLDLLDLMADPSFFGSIDVPKSIVSELDRLAGTEPEPSFLDSDLPPPPPPPGGDFDFLDKLPPPPDMMVGEIPDYQYDLPPPPPGLDALPLGIIPSAPEPPAVAMSKEKVKPPKPEPPVIILPEESPNYSFKSFAVNNFRDTKNKKTTDLSSFSKSIIRGPLLNSVPNELHKLAEQIFSKILAYMAEKKSDSTSLARFILKKGLANEQLRDEIYVQLIKQTTGNPSRESTFRGWELICYCVCTFLPSDSFIKYLGAYLIQESHSSDQSVKDFALFAMKCARRTALHGGRKMAPSGIELQALARRSQIVVKVRFMDGLEKAFFIDSATIALEAFDTITNTINLKETDGFAIFEAYNNIERKLALTDNMADAISKAESLAKSMKGKKIAFSFTFKKSIYHPAKSEYTDMIERDLIFHQIYNDFMESRIPSSDMELNVRLAAFKLQLDVGNYDPHRNIEDISARYIPEYLRSAHTDEEWKKLIFETHSKLGTFTKEDIKNEYILLCQRSPLYGALTFRNMESKNPVSPVPNTFDLAVNINGVHFLDITTKQIIKTIKFGELKKFATSNPSNLVLTLSGMNVMGIDCEGESGRIVAVLREHSEAALGTAKFARALFDYDVTDEHLLSLKKGDIIAITDKDQSGWYIGELRGKIGSFPAEYVEILLDYQEGASRGTLRPGATMRGETSSMTMYQMSKDSHMTDAPSVGTLRLRKEHRGTVRRKTIDLKTRMQFSRDPLKDSLLDIPSELNKEAKESFVLIMKYMQDYPSKSKDTKILQELVEIGIANEALRDEIFCQLMKQTTKNPKIESMRLGWELLAVCAGSFLPSEDLSLTISRYVEETVEANFDAAITEYATLAMKRSSELLIRGPRKLPPGESEVEAIKENKPVVIRIYLLDGTTKAIYANSFTTIKDAVEDLNEKFNLTHADGFSLYEVNHEADTILPLSSANYVCDYLAHWERFLQPSDKGLDSRYKFLYKRRTFLEDPMDDLQLMSSQNNFVFTLIFNQVLYEVKNGKIPVNLDEAIHLLAVQLYIKYGNYEKEKCPVNKTNYLNWLPKHLRGALDPDDILNRMAEKQQQLANISANDAKVLYIKLLKDHPLYGANVFSVMVKGKANASPTKAWAVFNRKGVGVWEPFSKDPRMFWPYDQISDFNPSRDSVCLSTGSLIKPEKFYFIGHEANYMSEVFGIFKAKSESKIM